MKISSKLASATVAVSLLSGCMSAQDHRAAVESSEGEKLTVGAVQRAVRVGMSGAEVAGVLGSPNIVSTDEQGREAWIYDRISTTRVASESRGGILTLLLGGGIVGSAGALGAGAPYYSQSAGAASTRQKTLTVIIKFAGDGKVRDFAYHTSRF